MKQIRVKFLPLLIVFLSIPIANALAAIPNGAKLEVSANKRFLEYVDSRGKSTPFFWFGDTAWAIFHRLTESEADQYFADREAKGFTNVLAVITAPNALSGVTTSSHNIVNGELPFHGVNPAQPVSDMNPPDPDKPNEAFFSHVDAVINKARDHNIYVALLPVWAGYICPAWAPDEPKLFDGEKSGKKLDGEIAKAKRYGAWIAKRYKDQPNIIWVLGGDRWPNHCGGNDVEIWDAIGNSIKLNDPNHLMTFHPQWSYSSASQARQILQHKSWLDFNMMQLSPKDPVFQKKGIVEITSSYYNRTDPIKPVMLGEGAYWDYTKRDGSKIFTDRQLRGQAYLAFLAGAFGFNFGQIYLWYFDKGETLDNPNPPGDCHRNKFCGRVSHRWQDYLNTRGTIWSMNMRDLFQSMKWWELIPDQSIILHDTEFPSMKNIDRKAAARLSSGDMVIVYYTTNSKADINLASITASSRLRAKWWNPVDKSELVIGKFNAVGSHSFTPPSGWEDAVLVLQSIPIPARPPP